MKISFPKEILFLSPQRQMEIIFDLADQIHEQAKIIPYEHVLKAVKREFFLAHNLEIPASLQTHKDWN